MADGIRADFDLHGVVSVRVEGARPSDLRALERQLGPLHSADVTEPDLVLRFAERIPSDGALRYLGRDEAAYDANSFFVLRGKHKARTRVRIPMQQIGHSCEILCEHGLPAVPLLVPIVNLTALVKGFVPLHAAALLWNGVGVVVTGWSKGGKTETLLSFMQRGARYVADEWCYLAPDGRRIFGIPEPVRLWRWQLSQLPTIRRRLPWGSRARLAALAALPALESGLPHPVQRSTVGRSLRRLSHFVGGQLHVNVPPERLFGAEAHVGEARFDHLVFVTSAERPDTAVRAIEPEEVADRMVHSLQYERLRLLEAYRTFRFAFPHLSNACLEKAEERERTLLQQAFSGKPAWCVEHPYPVELRQLFDCLEPLLR